MSRFRLAFLLAVSAGGALAAPGEGRAGTLALTADAGVRTMSNSRDTEKAIFDKKVGIGAALGASYDRGSRWRFGFEVRRIAREGERAFAADRTSEAFRLGHPLTLKMTEALGSVTLRFPRIGPVAPYLTAGGGVVSWREQSDTAGLIEKTRGTSGLFEGRLGLERQQGRLRIGLEAGLTFVPKAVGTGGISKVYEESDLGGLFVVAKVGLSRR